MAGEIIRPSALPPRADPVASEVLASDNGSVVGGITLTAAVNAGRPLASEAEAVAGVEATKAMTALTTKQAIVAQGDVRFATAAQGALADSATQPGDLATVATTGDYDDLSNLPVIPPGLTDGDKGDVTVSGSGTAWDLNDATVTAAKVTNDPLEWDAIAEKLLILSKDDFTLYVDPVNGVDDYGRGAIGAPFKTPQGAKDLGTSILTNGRVTIYLLNGEYTESYRTAISMQRPALIYVDQCHMGLRSDAPGGVLTASIVFQGESKAGVVLKPGSADGYIRGVYVTAAVGSIGFQNLTIDCQTGTESGMVAHRPGVYLHAYDIDILGNGIATYGLMAESQGQIEAINTTIDNCGVGAQVIAGGRLQLGLASDITNCIWGAIATGAGWVSLSVGAQCHSPILVHGGATLDTTGTSGSRILVAASIEVRNGAWSGAFVDVSGTITTRPGALIACGAMGWSGGWADYGGNLYIPGCKSFIAPDTQSTVATPLAFLGGVRNLYIDNTFELRNNAGNLVAESFNILTASIASNGATIPITLQGMETTINITAAAARTGVLMPTTQSGRLAGTPFPDGCRVNLVTGPGSSSIEIVDGTTSLLNGGSVTLGASSGLRTMVSMIYAAGRARWVCIRGDSQ